MRVDVTMPQMGESIAEGTITRWIKKVGDKVERDEPIFEISTDKVDAEIPAPQNGVLVEIKAQEGDTVPVNQVVAVLETEADGASEAAQSDAPTKAKGQEQDEAKTQAKGAAQDKAPAQPKGEAQADAAPKPKGKARADAPTQDEAHGAKRTVAAERPAAEQREVGDGRFVSPVVRRIAEEHDVDVAQLSGTGAGGRVTKQDILQYLDSPAEEAAPTAAPKATSSDRAAQPQRPAFGADRVVRERMSVMRKKIAEHMIESRRTSAHVHSVFEVDMTRIMSMRARNKDSYVDRQGVKLTVTPFFIKAVCDGLKAWPVVNASVVGEEIVYKKDLNIGVAVALDWGLIVPVVRNADELSIAGLAKRLQDLAQRARTKKLNPDEVQDGTFTITNPGQYGGLYGLPIINQPQVAILGIGGIEKRPVVIDDAIAIRSMMYMALSYDHRVVDGAVADQFLAMVKRGLEDFDESLL